MKITASGVGSLRTRDLTLTATQCPPNNVGFFYVGDTTILPSPLYDGLQCVVGRSIRFPPTHQPSGTATLAGALTADALYFSPGGTYFFQYFSRDVGSASPCGAMGNFSPAYAVTLRP